MTRDRILCSEVDAVDMPGLRGAVRIDNGSKSIIVNATMVGELLAAAGACDYYLDFGERPGLFYRDGGGRFCRCTG